MSGVGWAVLVFVGGPLLTWGLARLLDRWVAGLLDAPWEAQVAEWDDQVRALRAMHTTPGGLGDERGVRHG